jgi:hypothetical protein
MNKFFGIFVALALAFAMVPPLPGQAQNCSITLNNNDDFISTCNVVNRATRRVRVRQSGNVVNNQSFVNSTGGNIVVAGDDVKDQVGVASGNANINWTSTLRFNIFDLIFN